MAKVAGTDVMGVVVEDLPPTGLGLPEGAPLTTKSSGSAPWRSRLGVIAAFSIFTAFVSVVYWPGQMDPDSMDEWSEAATGHFVDWHTPMLSALWRIPYVMGVTSPGWVLAFSFFALLVGLYLVLRVRFGRTASTAVAILCCCWPPVLSWAVHIGRDDWFVELLLCAFGFAARMVRMGEQQRRFNLAAALVCAFLCSAAWQIGLVPLVVLFVLLAALLLPPGFPHRRLAACGAGLAACVALFGLQLGLERAIGTSSTHVEQGTYVYDLAQLSKIDGKVLFPSETLVPHKHALDYLNTIQPGAYDGIVFGKTAVVDFPIEGSHLTALRNAWQSAIVHHPWDYLRERTDLALAELAVTHPSFWTFQVPPDGPQFLPVSSALRDDGQNYLSNFAVGGNLYGDVLYTAWVYLLVVAAAVPLLLKRAARGDSAIAALAVSTLFLEVAVFFTAPALVYRYAYPVVVVGTVLAPTLLARPKGAHNKRRSAAV